MIGYLSFKFLIILKINNKGGLFYGKLLNFGYFQNCTFCIENKFEIEDVEYLS